MNKLLISGIDFSDEGYEQKFEIKQDALHPKCLFVHIVDKYEGEGLEETITLRASEMKVLGKALVFAAEYVEEFYEE